MLTKHLQTHGANDEDMKGESDVLQEIKMESPEFVPNDNLTQQNEEKPHVCTVCGKTFGSKAAMIRHYQKHTGEKSHACIECGQILACKYSLDQHMIYRHSEEKRFQCEICDKWFKTEVN